MADGGRVQLDELTSGRFFAAMWVVIYHQSNDGGLLRNVMHAAPEPVLNFCRTGYAAVGTFFVLSGFILTYTYGGNTVLDRRRFWVARLARIYPVYLVGLLTFAPFVERGTGSHLIATIKLIVSGTAALGLVQAWHPDLAVKWNTPGWSLSAEAFFYALFPWLAALTLRSSRKPTWQLTAGIALCWLVSALVPAIAVWIPVPGFGRLPATEVYFGFWGDAIKFNPLLRLPEFVAGMLLGRLFLTNRPRWTAVDARRVGRAAIAVGLVGLVLVSAVLAPYIPLPLFHNSVLLPFNALLVYGLAMASPGVSLLRQRWLVLLGGASYAVYILQIPTYHWVMSWDARWMAWGQTRPGILFAAYVALLIGLSVVTHVLVEEPGRAYLSRVLNRRASPPAGS